MKNTSLCLITFFLCVFASRALSQARGGSWFSEMYHSVTHTDSSVWKENVSQLWYELRGHFTDADVLLEMSWEERDGIWKDVVPKGEIGIQILANRYLDAYRVSCNERGIKPEPLDSTVVTMGDLTGLRAVYLASRKAEYVVLTPTPSKSPKINSPTLYGARPNHEIIYRIAVSGEKPMRYTVNGLPQGCYLDEEFGVIRGRVAENGTYDVFIGAQNIYGKDEQHLLIKVGEEIALTPPMGWNSWNSFACNVRAVDIKNAADMLINSGLADFGWNYVNIDDCWMKVPDIEGMPEGEDKAIRKPYYEANVAFRTNTKKVRFNEHELVGKTRDDNGSILSNKDFPDMQSVTGYLHQYGLKAGIYTSPGPLTCQRYEGSYGHEVEDAKQFAKWGFDYLKYDWCGYRGVVPEPNLNEAQLPYRLMGDALKGVNRDIVFSMCQYGNKDVWKWGESIGGNLWRTSRDIRDNWRSILRNGFSQAGLESYAGPGHWNDPDMLVVGYVGWSQHLRPTLLSPNEQYTHISLWSLLSAPLLIGCDLTRLDPFTYNLLSNSEVIKVNQDPLGKQASRVLNEGNIQVWAKPLADGSLAVGVFNLGETPASFKLLFSTLELSGTHRVRDVWRQRDIGVFNDRIDLKINRHGVKFLKLNKIGRQNDEVSGAI